ncbi:hypothetical protein BDV93DRAFT_291875 [Ceratobasidium sp. AG-I]|nr:hypothetical protein BDV93DRAFT_291875 [Ceratobasidium sp. AG-I]
MSGVPIQRKISNVIPLPGVGEIESVVKGLINAVQIAGCEGAQCDSLAKRLDGLASVADSCKELEGFTEMLNQIQDIKSRFELNLKRKLRISTMLRARDRLRAYDNLSHELDILIEKTQFKLSTNMLTGSRAQSSRRLIEQNFDTIRECDISFDDTEFPSWTRPSGWLVRTGEKVTYLPDPVITHYRFGRLGMLRVTYVSFSTHADYAAAERRTEEELRQLSRMRHPNVAMIAGVTKGYDGLNGFVVAAGIAFCFL